MILPSSPRRALVWAFHDVDGLLDAANERYLAALLEHVDEAVVVVNGAFDDASARRVEQLGARLIVRENRGYDVEAFAAGVAALEPLLPELDELIVANSSVFGPLRPLRPMFDRMAAQDLDLWGITRHAPARPGADATAPRAERAHIQSYFTAYRSSVLRSPAFLDWWRGLPPIEGYADAVRRHEMEQTGHFEDHGFRWGVAVDTADLEHLSANPIIGLAAQLVRERGCPIFKRRMLYLSLHELTAHSDGAASAELWRLLGALPASAREELIDHAVRTMPGAALRTTLQDPVWLDDAPAEADAVDAAVVVLDGPLAAAAVEQWTAAVPAARVALVGDDPASPAALAAASAGARLLHRGARPALLAALDLEAEHVLVLGDDARPDWAEDARIARQHALAALGADATAVRAAAAAFAADRTLGAIVPPPPLGRRLVGSVAQAPSRREAAALRAAGVGAPAPRTPGASLWVRRSALERLASIVDALPEGVASRLEHPTWAAVLLQALPGLGLRARTGVTRAAAATLLELGTAALAEIAEAVGAGAHDTLDDVLARAGGRPLDATVFFDTGGGYRHAGAQQWRFDNAGAMALECVVPEGTVGIRFDPAEGTALLVRGIAVTTPGYRIRPMNGTRSGRLDLFASHDPAYDVSGPMRAGDVLRIGVEHAERLSGSTIELERIERRFGPLGPIGRARALGVRAARKAVRVARSRLR